MPTDVFFCYKMVSVSYIVLGKTADVTYVKETVIDARAA